MRLRSTIDFLGLWESINNPQFKSIEFDAFKSEAAVDAEKKFRVISDNKLLPE